MGTGVDRSRAQPVSTIRRSRRKRTWNGPCILNPLRSQRHKEAIGAYVKPKEESAMKRINRKKVALPLLLGAALLSVTATGCKVTQTQDGKMPEVEVKGGQVPKYDVKGPKVDVKTETKQVEVPTDVTVQTEKKDIKVP